MDRYPVPERICHCFHESVSRISRIWHNAIFGDALLEFGKLAGLGTLEEK